MARWLVGSMALLALAGCKKGAEGPAEAEKKELAPVAVEMANVTVGPMDATVTAQGTLAPSQGGAAHVASATPGRLLSVSVCEGQAVRAGQVVATVDTRPLHAQAVSAQAALAVAGAQSRQSETAARAAAEEQVGAVETARLSLAAARQEREGAVRQAQSEVSAADTELKKTRSGARPQEIAQADQAVEQARATRDRAATELERVEFLFRKGVAARRQLDDAATAAKVAEAALESARQQAGLLRAGARAEEVRASEIRLQQAREGLTQARATGESKVALAESALRQAEKGVLQVAAKQQEALAARATVAQKRADLEAARATADYAEVRAPLSGTVTRRYLNPGDMADPATPIVDIAGGPGVDLAASLPAGDGAPVRPGMVARITSPDDPGRPATGRVLSVGQVDPQSNLLGVRIALDQPTRWKAGAFASAEIVLGTHPRALLIPREAVLTREDRVVAYVVTPDDVAHETTITLGPERGDLVEAATGLRAGERVIRLGQYELADGARVKAATEGKAGGAEKGD